MNHQLKDVATIEMGYSFRAALSAGGRDGVRVIQMKDLAPDNTVSLNELVRIDMGIVKNRQLVRKGDLIFRSRGLVTKAAMLTKDPENTLVAAPLLKIRIKNAHLVMPEYLNWYINQGEAQKFFKTRQEGTSVNMVSAAQLAELPVKIPPLAKQKAIVELFELATTEGSLLKQLAQKRQTYIAEILMRFAKDEKK